MNRNRHTESETDLIQGCEGGNTVAGVSIEAGREYKEVENRPPQSFDATLGMFHGRYWLQRRQSVVWSHGWIFWRGNSSLNITLWTWKLPWAWACFFHLSKYVPSNNLMVNKRQVKIGTAMQRSLIWQLFKLPASTPSSLPPHCPMLGWYTCLQESKARATNYSHLQRNWSVMMGPAQSREGVTAKNNFKHCHEWHIYFFRECNINAAGSSSSRANLNQSQDINYFDR